MSRKGGSGRMRPPFSHRILVCFLVATMVAGGFAVVAAAAADDDMCVCMYGLALFSTME